jgi:hypothetical protein
VAPFNQSALLASRLVSTLGTDIDQKVAELTRKFPGRDSSELRLRLWIVESTIVLLAGENSTADVARLERFFGAFWSDVSNQLQWDLPGEDVPQEFDAGMDRLTAEIASDRRQLAPEQVSPAMGNRITAFLDVPEGEPLAYGYKLATSTKLLNQLPE